MSEWAGIWQEHLIHGDPGAEVAFSSVLSNPATGELVIVRYDRWGIVHTRYEWQPHARGEGKARLTLSGWDDQEATERSVPGVPDPPRDLEALQRLLAGLDC